MISIWNPNQQPNISGIYCGLYGFEFKENETTYMIGLRNTEQAVISCLPRHWQLDQIFRVNASKLVEEKTFIEVALQGRIEVGAPSELYAYSVKFDGIEVIEHKKASIGDVFLLGDGK